MREAMSIAMNISVDLGEIFLEEEWDETAAGIVLSEVKAAIKADVRKRIKEDPKFRKIVDGLWNKAYEDVMAAVEPT